ncbi:hypothetical protein PV325_011088 [Microctonus aethiopoides]|nr:hypothetical protein PV325_011088 [Microctonus aethiopoides]
MSLTCKDVILCKGLSDKNTSQEDYVECLTSAGYNCMILATLSFKFVNRDDLYEYLSHPESHCGLILTSPRSIEAINYAVQGNIDNAWRKLPAYCVGPSTELLAVDCLKLDNCDGSQCGNAEDLAKYIIHKSKLTDKSLLYPCSAIARDTLPKILETGGIKIDKVVVYETEPSKILKDDLVKVITNVPQIFVFFSPSTVQYITDVAHKNSISLDNIKSVAIGPVTATALDKAGLKVYATAVKPEPSALLQAIKHVENQRMKNKC